MMMKTVGALLFLFLAHIIEGIVWKSGKSRNLAFHLNRIVANKSNNICIRGGGFGYRNDTNYDDDDDGYRDDDDFDLGNLNRVESIIGNGIGVFVSVAIDGPIHGLNGSGPDFWIEPRHILQQEENEEENNISELTEEGTTETTNEMNPEDNATNETLSTTYPPTLDYPLLRYRIVERLKQAIQERSPPHIKKVMEDHPTFWQALNNTMILVERVFQEEDFVWANSTFLDNLSRLLQQNQDVIEHIGQDFRLTPTNHPDFDNAKDCVCTFHLKGSEGEGALKCWLGRINLKLEGDGATVDVEPPYMVCGGYEISTMTGMTIVAGMEQIEWDGHVSEKHYWRN